MKRLAPLAVLAVLVAACGGSGRMSKADYQQRLLADGKPVQQTVTALTKSGSITSIAQFAAKADAAEAAVKTAADDLASLKPPKEVETDNTEIVNALRAIQSGLEHLKKVAVSGGSAAVLAAAAALETSPQLKTAEKAIADLKTKGYTVGFLGL